MCSAKDVQQKIAAFHDRAIADPHHRYRVLGALLPILPIGTREAIVVEKDAAALQLGFYVASWGMYRGSSFLLQRAYTVHTGAVERLAPPEFSELWDTEVGSDMLTCRVSSDHPLLENAAQRTG